MALWRFGSTQNRRQSDLLLTRAIQRSGEHGITWRTISLVAFLVTIVSLTAEFRVTDFWANVCGIVFFGLSRRAAYNFTIVLSAAQFFIALLLAQNRLVAV